MSQQLLHVGNPKSEQEILDLLCHEIHQLKQDTIYFDIQYGNLLRYYQSLVKDVIQ